MAWSGTCRVAETYKKFKMTSRPQYYTRLGVLVYQRRNIDEGRRAWRENTRCYLSRNMLRLEGFSLTTEREHPYAVQ